ncbi:MAG: DUF554 domain-containing protein [Cellulosilyticaceae bacterium]
MFLGTLVNVICIIIGGIIGVLAQKGIPKRFADLIMSGIGLVTMVIGLSFALPSQNILIVVVSVVIGGILGEWIDLDRRLESLADKVKGKVKGNNSRLGEGIVTATLLFCVGSMAIMGALDSGIRGDHSILFTKSVMDGIASALFASSMGIGVILSAVPLFLYQGLITLLASFLEPVLIPQVITELNAVGGVLLLGLSLSILEIKKIKVVNLLPALVVAVIVASAIFNY